MPSCKGVDLSGHYGKGVLHNFTADFLLVDSRLKKDRMMVIPQGPPAQRRYHLDKLEAQVNGSFMDSATQEGAPLPAAPPPQLTSDEVDSPPDASPKEDDSNNSDNVPSPEKSSVRQTSPQGYQCKLCTLVASSQSALEEHMNIHTGSRPYHCLECGFSCSLQNTLTQHLATHHQKDVNNVNAAIETPSYENNLERLKEQTYENNLERLKEQTYENNLERLKEQSYENNLERLKEQTYENNLERLKEQSLTESAPTATTASHNDHLPTSGMVTSPVTTAAPPLQQLPTLPAGVPPSFHEHSKSVFQCKLCTHISPTKTHLNEHMNVHSGKKPYKCLVCGFSSAFRSSLMRHLIVHTGTSKQYKCDACHYQTPYKCNLQAHRRKRHSINDTNMDLANYQSTTHHSTSPIHNASSLIQVQDPNKLMAHIQENNIDMRSHYPLSAEALNSFLPTSAAAALNSGNHRPQPPSPNGSNTSASNDAQEMFIHHKNLNMGSESGDHPPILDKSTPNSNESDPKDMMDFSGATMINNDMPMTTSASTTAPHLNAALPGGPLGLPPVTLPPRSFPPIVTSPHGEISVITPLQWAGAAGPGFPIFSKKKVIGARKRKRTPVPKREFLVSPTGEDISDPWADNGRDSASANGDSHSDVYRNVAREYAKGEHGALNGGLDLSRDSSFADQDMGHDVSPSSGEATAKEDGMHSPESPIGDGSLLTRSTQTDPSSYPESQSHASNDLASQLNKCPHCATYFADHVIFTLHMSCHGQRNPYQCSICGYTCRDKIEFTCHITRSQHR